MLPPQNRLRAPFIVRPESRVVNKELAEELADDRAGSKVANPIPGRRTTGQESLKAFR